MIGTLAAAMALYTMYTDEQLRKLARSVVLPFGLSEVILNGSDLIGALDRLEEENKYCLQGLAIVRNLRLLLFVMTLDDMHLYFNHTCNYYRAIARWRLQWRLGPSS